ncbi:fimbrial protein [Pseudomonas abietaniphila]|uniref:fimbrial protein n=1 Tax=Pseudomonas abietaniphila TaxID=89065 RepID=UPI0032176876
MKKSFAILPLGLLLGFAASSAMAKDGTINFIGKIVSNTCPIDVIDPGSGNVSSSVSMGEVNTGSLAAVGDEAGGGAFQLKVSPDATCVVGPGKTATVTFNAVQGSDPSGENFAIKAGAGAADGVAIAIKDAKGLPVKNGLESSAYPIDDTNESLLYFTALYKRIGALNPGQADADVDFTVHFQ